MKANLGNFQAVRQMEGPNGPIKNQFIIYTDKGRVFQSYNTVIAARLGDGEVLLDERNWEYSRTTGKYRNLFLAEGINDTRRKIESGEYKLVDLN
ncbi:MAG: hypothetical protein WCQ69_11345 [Bacteroidales bacterium]|jgi:hypothetical protein|nr:hypothetical protein [Clostridiales bacterium]